MKILAIETSTNICGITYREAGENKYTVESDSNRKHAEVLPSYYKEIQNQSEFELKDVDGIAISIGPGSFTGLRVGLSFAKGLAFSQDLPLIPVPTLMSIAHGSNLDGSLGVLLYSHGEKVYYQSFQNVNNTIIPKGKIDICSWQEVPNNSMEGFEWIHWGCDNFAHEFQNNTQGQPSSTSIAELGETHFNDWIEKDPKMIVPNYISSFNFGSPK